MGNSPRGYLSLIKYLAFINSLITGLEQSGLCCAINGISVSPLGYADDVASASTSKYNTDRVLRLVYDHSCMWRYRFNPKKSAVLVFGETDRENKNNSKFRTYKLGDDPIKETNSYDHLGLKNNCLWHNRERIIEKISKGRRTLNAASGIGLKPGGLTMKACGLVFWAMVVPVVTFACELWVIKDEDIKLLDDFQAYAGRRIQRFRQCSPRATSFVGLGWLRLELYVYVKKLLFIRTIAVLDDDSIYKRVFLCRFNVYNQNREVSRENSLHSPTFDLLKISEILGLYLEVGQMLHGTRVFSKRQWRDLVWSKAWHMENQDWYIQTNLFKSTEFISATIDNVKPLIWWQLSDMSPEMMIFCETMSKLVCKASKLKSDDYHYKNDAVNRPYCELCPDLAIENVEHLLIHCPSLRNERDAMFNEISNIENFYGGRILMPNENNLHTLLGKIPNDVNPEMMLYFYKSVARNVHTMYSTMLRNRQGIG